MSEAGSFFKFKVGPFSRFSGGRFASDVNFKQTAKLSMKLNRSHISVSISPSVLIS